MIELWWQLHACKKYGSVTVLPVPVQKEMYLWGKSGSLPLMLAGQTEPWYRLHKGACQKNMHEPGPVTVISSSLDQEGYTRQDQLGIENIHWNGFEDTCSQWIHGFNRAGIGLPCFQYRSIFSCDICRDLLGRFQCRQVMCHRLEILSQSKCTTQEMVHLYWVLDLLPVLLIHVVIDFPGFLLFSTGFEGPLKAPKI